VTRVDRLLDRIVKSVWTDLHRNIGSCDLVIVIACMLRFICLGLRFVSWRRCDRFYFYLVKQEVLCTARVGMLK
jgi:hypothetical protein